MGDMLIRGIPEALKTEIEASARKHGNSLSAEAIDLLRKGMVEERRAAAEFPAEQDAWNAIRGIFVAAGAVGGEYSQVLDEVEAERKRYFGRPSEITE